MVVLLVWISIAAWFRVSQAGCTPSIAFPPPSYEESMTNGTFDSIQEGLEKLVTGGLLDNVSLSLEIASSQRSLFGFQHTSQAPTMQGTKNVTASTIYRVASNTKLFTALSILQQEYAGKIQLDAPITEYVSDLKASEKIDWSGITVKSLMAHVGGLPNNFADLDLSVSLPDAASEGLPPVSSAAVESFPKCGIYTNYTVGCTDQEFLQGLTTFQPLFPPRTQPSYSNIGFALLGLVIKNATGLAPEEYMDSNILKPLGMSHSSFTTPAVDLAVVPDGSQFASNLSSDNPSGGLYSTSSDMIKFLQHALGIHNNISTTLDWFQPASYGPGSHSLIGYPWEIFRPTSLLLNNTRPVTLNTKGGGLAGYYSYSIIIPDYNLVMFMVVGGDSSALPALNVVRDAVVGPVVQLVEDQAQLEMTETYGGTFSAGHASSEPTSSYKPSLNSSIMVAQSRSKNLYLADWVSNGTDALQSFTQVAASQGGTSPDLYFQVIPTFEERTDNNGSVGEVWRFINVLNDSGEEANTTTAWNDYCIANVDPLNYAGVPFNEMVFWRRNTTKEVHEVELPALQIRLGRVQGSE